MLDLLAILIFFASLSGMAVIFFRKAPLLASLPKTTPVFEVRQNLLWKLWTTLVVKVKNLPPFKDFSSEMLLQRVLSRFRVFTLKAENQTARWLEALRKKSQQNNRVKENDHYWEKLEKKE